METSQKPTASLQGFPFVIKPQLLKGRRDWVEKGLHQSRFFQALTQQLASELSIPEVVKVLCAFRGGRVV